MSKRIQVSIKSKDLENKIAAECKTTGLNESQLAYMIINKYYYDKKDKK